MKLKRYGILLLALLLIALSVWGQATARRGLVVRSSESASIPMQYLAPENAKNIPGVLIAHGFAGSKQLMLGYAHVLAHAGYAVMLWDFGGHAANSAPLNRFTLQKDLDIATTALLEQPEVDATRLALLGHSMGSGAVMTAGISNVKRFAATIAISPTGAAVTPSAPRNLQLQAGSWEGRFVANAQRLLQQAGGESEDLASGRGRQLIIIPNVEHITILFNNASHQIARKWLDATFGGQNNSNYVDRRTIWYGLHLLAWLMALGAIAPILIPATEQKSTVPSPRRWGGLLLAPIAASGLLLLLSRLGELQTLGGLQVGGALGIWFFLAGTIWLAILSRLPRPNLRAIGLGIGLFALLWIAFGAMAQVVWLQWWLIPLRLRLVPLLSVACLPWFLASGVVQQGIGLGKRLIWWLGQSLALVGGLWLALYWIPNLGFIFLLLPLFPPIIGILSYAAAVVKDAWIYAVGSALFFGWMIAAAFPLAG